jgi:hypothetical protein
MAPLVSEIRANIAAHTATANTTSPLKFALWSGHDNTIMPLLAAVAATHWDGAWAPYAAMIVFELIQASDFLIRKKPLLYFCKVHRFVKRYFTYKKTCLYACEVRAYTLW